MAKSILPADVETRLKAQRVPIARDPGSGHPGRKGRSRDHAQSPGRHTRPSHGADRLAPRKSVGQLLTMAEQVEIIVQLVHEKQRAGSRGTPSAISGARPRTPDRPRNRTRRPRRPQ